MTQLRIKSPALQAYALTTKLESQLLQFMMLDRQRIL